MVGGLGAVAGPSLLGACSSGSGGRKGASDTIKVGVISPFS
ncbi:MAG: hypothetical protein QOH66_2918, partial [Actinomycetota bacterium]|nr:hypothetical protein [Actinomycetota bacterium]